MTMPLVILAAFAILLGVIGTPAWPWFDSFLDGEQRSLHVAAVLENRHSSRDAHFLDDRLPRPRAGLVVLRTQTDRQRRSAGCAGTTAAADSFTFCGNKFYVDEFYEATFIRCNAWLSRVSDWFDRWIWNGAVWTVSHCCAWAFLACTDLLDDIRRESRL